MNSGDLPEVLGFGDAERAHAPAGSVSTTLEDAASAGKPVLALYRAPWVAFLDGADATGAAAASRWLAEWIRFHRAVLALHQRFPGRVVLVNTGALEDAGPLIAHLRELGFACGDSPGPPEPASGPENVARALQSLLAAGMADASPDAWTVYEELESRALLLGREPEFRGADATADLSDPGELLAGFAALRAGIATALEQARAAPSPEPSPSPSDVFQQENELLGLHLEQVLEELQFHSERGRQLEALLQEAGEVSEAARILISELRSGERAPD